MIVISYQYHLKTDERSFIPIFENVNNPIRNSKVTFEKMPTAECYHNIMAFYF